MGYFNPITYFIKKFISIFTKKFFWVILITFLFMFSFIFSCVLVSDSKAYNINQANINTTDYDVILEDNTIYNNIVTSAVQKWHTEVQANPNIILYNDIANSNYVVLLCIPNRCNCSFNNNDIIITNNFSDSNTGVWRYVYWYDGSFRYINKDISLTPNTSTTTGVNAESYLYSNIILYNTSDNIVYPYGFNSTVMPYIVTSSSSIENWNFDYFTISSNISLDLENIEEFRLTFQFDNFYYQDITGYLNYTPDINDTWVISIPRSEFFNNVTFNSLNTNNYPFSFTLDILGLGVADGVGTYNLGNYYFNLSTEQTNAINTQNSAYQQQQIINKQQDIESTINDSNISDYGGGFRDFSNDMNITDNTSIDNLFTMIYNAFTHDYNEIGQPTLPHDLEITIPFVNQTIKINPYNVYGTEYGYSYIQVKPELQPLQSFANLFYWAVIGLWVLKDIRGTINKVAEGNIENASSDIKKELL